MTAGNDPKRPLIGPAVVQIRSNGQRAVVGMRPELNVLVPFHFFPPFRPFEIELRVMKLYVRPDEIGRDVGNWRLDHEIPVHRVMLDRARQAPQSRFLSGVSRFQVEHCIRFFPLAAAFHHLGGD